MEMTSQVEEQLDKQMGPFTDVPCGDITVWREHGRRNLPCQLEWREPKKAKHTGGSADNGKPKRPPKNLDNKELQAALMRIWKLPTINKQQTESEYLEALNTIIRLRTTYKTEGPPNP
jgi:hypothetical protein